MNNAGLKFLGKREKYKPATFQVGGYMFRVFERREK
jgi:hypothetical protein